MGKKVGGASDLAGASDAAGDPREEREVGAGRGLTLTPAEVRALRRSCTRFVAGDGPRTAADYLAQIPPDTEVDFYGIGGVVEELEREVATILGKPAAAFMPSGIMAQQIALRIHADRRGRRGIVFHPLCHVDQKELRAYEQLHGLRGHPVGEPHRLLTLADLTTHRWLGEPMGEAPAVLLLELPQRDIGGELPAWNDLDAQVEWARGRGAAVHLDGARLWGCEAFYGRSLAEIAALFDTVYVSFYKQLGGLAGCALAGPNDIVLEAKDWRRRHGGMLYGLWPNAASGLTALRARLPRMAVYQRHALAIADALRDLPDAQVVPDPPHTPMFHLLLRRETEALSDAALRLAHEEGTWTFHRLSGTEVPGVHRWEIEVGEATLTWTPAEVRSLVERLLRD
jgi:threonine aldolase